MASYWWECSDCGKLYDFSQISSSKGIAHFIWDELMPSNWNQKILIKKCTNCEKRSVRISYEFPRAEKTSLQVKHIIGIGPFNEEYLPMMWETIPDGNINETWIDFKYLNGRNIYGLNKPAVFTKEDIKEIFRIYREVTTDNNFPY